jgi:hypothetical protein
MTGGAGGVVNALVDAFIMGVINNGLTVIDIDVYALQVFLWILIIIASRPPLNARRPRSSSREKGLYGAGMDPARASGPCGPRCEKKDAGGGKARSRQMPLAMEESMKQQVMTSPGRIEFRNIPVPVPAANEVLIRMKRIGVCGSDINFYHGKHALTPYPVVQGHEVSGIVEKVGASVKGFAAGEAVTIQPQVTCGTCYPCTHGAYHICDSLKVMGFQTTGAG